jgi:ribosomal-protein-alanine N-acetyltransferase
MPSSGMIGGLNMNLDKLFSDSPEFWTERLHLRKINREDAAEYFAFASDPEVTRHTIWNAHETIEDGRKFIERVLTQYEQREAFHWGIIDRMTNRLIGRVGFIHFDVSHDKTELGFALAKSCWGKGIMTEAARQIVDYAFRELGVNRVEGRCNHDNLGSSRVMEKLGMKLEGILRKQLKIKNQYVDQKMYSIIKDDLLEERVPIRLRLAKVPEDCSIAVQWYRDPEVLYYSEGKGVEPYSLDDVRRMYEYLQSIGTLYLIEIEENGRWIPIGDATLSQETLPIVIGEKKYRSRGIGKRVLQMLIDEAKRNNWRQLKVKQIFDYNERSRRLFTGMGFEVAGEGVDENGNCYNSYILRW